MGCGASHSSAASASIDVARADNATAAARPETIASASHSTAAHHNGPTSEVTGAHTSAAPTDGTVTGSVAAEPITHASDGAHSAHAHAQARASSADRRQAAAARVAAQQAEMLGARQQETSQQVKQVKAALRQVAAQGEAAVAGQRELAAKLNEVADSVAAGRLPPRIHNVPKVCAHFTARDGVMQQVCAAFASARDEGAACPIVALTGIAGSGKSELAKQWAISDFNRAETNADASGSKGEEHRLCWFLNAESEESLLRSYKLLCSALRLEWKAEEKESEADTFARMKQEAEQQMMRYDTLLLFDNAVSLDMLEPYLPSLAGLRVRVLLTSLHESVILPDARLGRHVVSLNRGLSEDEAVSLMERTSGMRFPAGGQSKDGQDARDDALALLRELDCLPLAVSTAGLYIAAQRQPKRSMRAKAAAAPPPSYGPRDFLRELRSHSSKLLQLGATLKGQSDYKHGQSTALQMAIGKTPPRIRALLDYCTLLDSQALSYELLADLYATTSKLDSDAVEEEPMDADSVADAFDAMLESPDLFSLLCVDWDTRRIYMHRSTQLQLAILGETQCAVEGKSLAAPPMALLQRKQSTWRAIAATSSPHATVGHAAAAAAASAPSTPADPALAAAYDTSLRTTPSPLHRWKAQLVGELLSAISRCWPAREEDTVSLLALEPIVPTLTRLLEECSELPMLHADLAPLHAQLMSQMSLLMLHLEAKEEWTQLQQLATQVRLLCESGSEPHQLMRMWFAVSLSHLNDESASRQSLRSLLDELTNTHPSISGDRVRWDLRVRVALHLAALLRFSNVAEALELCEEARGWVEQHGGDSTDGSLLLARVWFETGRAHLERMDARNALNCMRKSLAIAQRVCGEGSAQAADVHSVLAPGLHDVLVDSIAPEASFAHRQAAQSVYDQVHGPCSRVALASVKEHADRLLNHDPDAAIALLVARCDQLVRAPDDRSPDGQGTPGLGEHERTVAFMAEAGDLLCMGNSQSAEGAMLEQRAYEMAQRVHGEAHAVTMELMARTAARQFKQAQEDESADRSQVNLRCRSVCDRFTQLLPRVQGRTGVVLARLRSAALHFLDMDNLPLQLLVLQHLLLLIQGSMGPEHDETGRMYASVAEAQRGVQRYAEAAQSMREALRITLAHGDVASGVSMAEALADILLQLRDEPGEEAARLQALQLAHQAAGPLTDHVAEQHALMAGMWERRREYSKALVAHLCAIRIRQITGFKYIQQSSDSLEKAFERSMLTETPGPLSHSDLQRVLSAVTEALPSDPLALAMSHLNLARALLTAGPSQVDEADALQQEALRMLHAGGHPDRFVADALGVSAAVHQQRGEFTQELTKHKQRLELLLGSKNDMSKRGSEAHNDIALVHMRMRQYSAAIPHLEAAASASAPSSRSLAEEHNEEEEGEHDDGEQDQAQPGEDEDQGNAQEAEQRELEEDQPEDGDGQAAEEADGTDKQPDAHALEEKEPEGGELCELQPEGIDDDDDDGDVTEASSADVRIEWCRKQIDSSQAHQSHELRFDESDRMQLQREGCESGLAANVILGAGDPASPYKLRPLPSSPRTWYFEVTLTGEGSSVSIGLASAEYSLCDELGAMPHSVGWNGSTGILRCAPFSASPREYGPIWSDGDVLGAGVDLDAGVVFFVHNGVRLRDVPVDVTATPHLHAAMSFGAEAQEERLLPNMGDSPFSYDHAMFMDPALTSARALCPYQRIDPRCHWIVSFDGPMHLRRTVESHDEGCVVLAEAPHRLRPLSASHPQIRYYEITVVDADSGSVHCGGERKRECSPAWSAGDVIGCGVDRDASLVFFTLNGRRVYELKVDVTPLAHACICFQSRATSEQLRLNMGDEPFKYDHTLQGSQVVELPRCSWLVTFDTPLTLRRTKPLRDVAGSAVLTDVAHKLRPLSSTHRRILYFELRLLDAGDACDVTMGFAHGQFDAGSMSGWGAQSIGYHAGSGKLFHGGPFGSGVCGPVWRVGDVVGAGLDLDAGLLFFTHAGVRLSDIPADVASMPYACVGFGGEASTENVELNMGDVLFAFRP